LALSILHSYHCGYPALCRPVRRKTEASPATSSPTVVILLSRPTKYDRSVCSRLTVTISQLHSQPHNLPVSSRAVANTKTYPDVCFSESGSVSIPNPTTFASTPMVSPPLEFLFKVPTDMCRLLLKYERKGLHVGLALVVARTENCYEDVNLNISQRLRPIGSCSIRPDSFLRVVSGLRD
jgi:hypothetical protein